MSRNHNALVSICVCTYRRPQWLQHTLESLRKNISPLQPVEIIIVDNDTECSAESVVSSFDFDGVTNVHYFHESNKNISIARNRAIKESNGQWLALIDDDEFAHESWLSHLLKAAESHEADVVFGPVLPVFSERPPSWIVEGRFFDRGRHTTGARVGWHDARSGNALIRSGLLSRIECPFSESFGLTGGEDSVLFKRLQDLQTRMIWCDEAIVYEHVPPDRANLKWLLTRSFRIGQIWARIELDSFEGIRLAKAIEIGLIAGLRIATAIPLALLTAPTSTSKCVTHLRTLANRAGKLTALFGLRHNGY